MSRSDGTTRVDYVWDVAAGLPMLLQDGTNTYVYGLGLISIYDGSEMTYRLVDGLGSTVNLCDEDGDVVGSYLYDAYGNVRSQSGSETEFSFAGEQNDPNGLDYLRARYYDPEIGRFLSGDPLGGGYSYATNNPANYVDPSGHYACPPGPSIGSSEGWMICVSYDGTYTYVLTGEALGRYDPLYLEPSATDVVFELVIEVAVQGGKITSIDAWWLVDNEKLDNIAEYVTALFTGGGCSFGIVGCAIGYGVSQWGTGGDGDYQWWVSQEPLVLTWPDGSGGYVVGQVATNNFGGHEVTLGITIGIDGGIPTCSYVVDGNPRIGAMGVYVTNGLIDLSSPTCDER